MFLGEYQHTLDPKGRLILPSAFRDELAEGLVMTVGIDSCVTIHPRADWGDVVTDLRRLQTTDPRQRRFARTILSYASPQELDRQGRVSVPSNLRRYAALDKDVAVVGNDTRLELWDAARWATYLEQGLEDFANTDEPFGVGKL